MKENNPPGFRESLNRGKSEATTSESKHLRIEAPPNRGHRSSYLYNISAYLFELRKDPSHGEQKPPWDISSQKEKPPKINDSHLEESGQKSLLADSQQKSKQNSGGKTLKKERAYLRKFAMRILLSQQKRFPKK